MNAERQSPLHWLVSDPPPAGQPQPVLLDIGDEDAAACLADLSHLPCRAVVLTGSLASARQARRLLECEVVVGRATAIPFASRCLQSMGCFRQFERIVDKETSCREWLRTVRPYGRIMALVKLAGGAGRGRAVTDADWSAYFRQRGLHPDRIEAASPSPGGGSAAHMLLRTPTEEQPEVFFSGPFPDAEARRLSAEVEKRLSLRRAGDLDQAHRGKHARAVDRGGNLPLAPYLDEADVYAFTVLGGASAPLFARSVGGGLTGLLKILLNLPLRLFGRPQNLFNRMVREVLGVCLRVLREVTGFQRLLRNELNTQRATLDRLLDENARLRERIGKIELGLGDVGNRPDVTETVAPAKRGGPSQGDNM